MTVLSYADSALSLLPPVVAIILAIMTRKVLLSLGVGILIGTLLLNQWSVTDSAIYLSDKVSGLFWSNGAPNSWNLYILGFLIVLGMITALITVSGSARAFANWAKQHIRKRRDAKLLTMFLGCVVFIDDYFNSLVVGSICKPLTDRYYISRAKLAYLLDSTAAPVCVISPVSSWGAYIIALIGGILTTHGVTSMGHLTAFVEMIPMNFYPLFALLLLLFVAMFELDVGPMRRHELSARKGQLYDEAKGVPPGATAELAEAETGKVGGLFIPISVLVVATLYFMIASGADVLSSEGKPFSVIGAFEKTDVSSSLFFGALLGLFTTLVLAVRQKLSFKEIALGIYVGAKSMLPAIYILLFAWTISGIIGQLETGKFMASLAGGNIPFALLPAVLFVLAGFTAFATGTSWGTFGIMLPIAADMAMGTHQGMMLPMMAAVLSGSVFGDHCSPISDTTILSSTGASCHHIDHVMTQLPYALLVAVISLGGYLVMGYTESVALGLLSCLVLFFIGLFWFRLKSDN
ncbi:Na+/H+ antiporter NhaC family protein [Shewanella sp. A32]|uniref:Na+/H+ antiporter NhaC family protein n=1 Tax=Shewanella sp. A32 TaxID=3031327 RepID=UPI0023B9648A|nr:Na+/H+ antiporter NhaC family protein [Shewanella sp. A32]MDF0532892.1 Na+/H+ antiporter NhaC family protein [Shewanella sp. A32]